MTAGQKPQATVNRMSDARVGTLMAIASMLLVQIGLAVALGLVDDIGVAGTTWLRVSWAAVILLFLVRPRRRDFSPAALRACVVLGVVTAGTALFFMAAISRLPLGMAVALEFLGPLGVAVARSRGGNKAWPLIAAVGVVLLTRPWSGEADLIGVTCWVNTM
jgi:inner membrane transporter RhtA